MKVTERTKYLDFVGVERYLKEDASASLYKSAQDAFVKFENLTLAQFLKCCDGYFSEILNRPAKRSFFARMMRRKTAPLEWTINPTVLQIYWAKGFGEWAKEFAATLEKLQVPQTQDEQQAAAGLPKMTFAEGMLIFVRSYFNLPDFGSAEKITIAEILIAKHDSYCAAMYQKKLHAIQLKKAKAKK